MPPVDHTPSQVEEELAVLDDTAGEASGRERMNRARGLRSGTLHWAWATLTSMRTALALLLLLGIAAIPGSLLPQRPTNAFGVASYLTDHPDIGPWLDRLGFFDVFGSVWFSAIYLLLFISLIGCIIPRCAVYYRALRAEPGPVPGRLARFPGYRRGVVEQPASDVLAAAEAHLRAARYRVRVDSGTVSAERGYAREAGNLVFHLALVAVLIGLAIGSLFGYRGTAIVVEGQAFSDTLTQFDDFSAGVAFAPSHLPAFTVGLDSFEVQFETGPVQTGAARLFRAHVTVSEPGRPSQQRVLEVNAPLSIGGADVHLLGHGYAPVVTVRDANGDVAYSGPVVFLPADGNFLSNGVIKAPDARPERLYFESVFLPTAVVDSQGMRSVFPDALRPQLLVNVWAGPPKTETGAPENVYVLDKTGLTQLKRADGQPVRASLEPGTSFDLPDGKGSVTFDGLRRWTKLQISSSPGGWAVLGSVLAAIAGLTVSLLLRPRRLFVRVRRRDDASTVVEVAGLDRVDGRPGLPEAVANLATSCGLPLVTAASDGDPVATGGPEGFEPGVAEGTLAPDPGAPPSAERGTEAGVAEQEDQA